MKESDKLPEFLDTPYAITKLLGGIVNLDAISWLNTVILRLFNSYGPGNFWKTCYSKFYHNSNGRKIFTITG